MLIYYGFIQDDHGNSNHGIGEIIVAKHRNGALDKVRLRFIGEYARFENVDNYGDDVSGNTSTTALQGDNQFDSTNQMSYTIPSKMNESNLDDLADFGRAMEDKAPF
jgi:replicative DNA helicase